MAKDWRQMMHWCAELLERATGEDVAVWNRRVAESGIDTEAQLRVWLADRGVSGYAQMLLVMERFGYPDHLLATADELFGGQYADRPVLRPVADRVIESAQLSGAEVTVQMRKAYVAFVGPRRTFAQLVPSTKSRIDLGLRIEVDLAEVAADDSRARLLPAKNLGNRTCPVRIPLTDIAEVDEDVAAWLARAYDANL